MAARALILNDLFKLWACNESPWQSNIRVHGESGGQNALERFHQAGQRLWPDHGTHPLPVAGLSTRAAGLCLAGLRHVAEISCVAEVSRILDQHARGTASFGDGRPLQADQ